ncbi:glycosyltransferase family 2 protein [Aquitalea pelogenes]|uniref:glycosyltransferase family 2 protein n=1 Tax=Aquitalea pelogenes TaxID=1293573 RepID=UPI0035B103BD
MAELPSVTVIVCTYRRPRQLQALLDSLALQHVEGLRPCLCIVDNDAEQSARELVAQAQQDFPWPIQYISQPVKNIALTRNAGLSAVKSDYLAFVDDDEIACSVWLSSLVFLAQKESAQLVFGPVLPVYPENIAAWMIEGKFFERPRHNTGHYVPVGEARTGNVLIDSAFIQNHGWKFDEKLGLSGGEDSAFFENMYRAGALALWADEAEVFEEVPVDRATVGWLLRRSFRIGSVEASLACARGSMWQICRIISKIGYLIVRSVILAVAMPFRKKSDNFKVLRSISLAAGICYGLIAGPYNEYK